MYFSQWSFRYYLPGSVSYSVNSNKEYYLQQQWFAVLQYFLEPRRQCNGHTVHSMESRGSEPAGHMVVSSADSHCRLRMVRTCQVSHVCSSTLSSCRCSRLIWQWCGNALCPSWSAAKIKIHLNTTQLDRNVYHFNYTNYYLFNTNCTSCNKIYSLVSKI